jgi:hypothetical protein
LQAVALLVHLRGLVRAQDIDGDGLVLLVLGLLDELVLDREAHEAGFRAGGHGLAHGRREAVQGGLLFALEFSLDLDAHVLHHLVYHLAHGLALRLADIPRRVGELGHEVGVDGVRLRLVGDP